MVETKVINLGGKDYTLRCSLLVAEEFERLTGKKFTKALSKYRSLGKDLPEDDEEATNTLMDSMIEIEMDALNMAYCMVKDAQRNGFNKDFAMASDEFISEIGALNSEELKGVLQLAMSLFPRKVSN